MVSDNTSKSKILYELFFPPPPHHKELAPLHLLSPPEAFPFRHITDHQITQVIKQMKDFWAPGPDNIPNEVYKQCVDMLILHIGWLYSATFDLKYYPNEWKNSKTIVLRKPGRADYSTAKSYRPIALLNSIAKGLSACVAESAEHNIEQLNLMPPNHLGGWAGRTASNSLHLIVKTVKDAW
ncbi:uncharacterized protein FIBRA_09197 [Fibroporia radiculosa]|uniref:Reverse transcriptase domain-containing protein n=1 Tax=Fibroporia radiculosa TaxID=599839 RepID=J7RH42_9APHY|nr:uncharacterized protein FIBRA_09197 [Fibroporia radiculosa]CCM06887.1 predicted protein [Fibroporia radiculosa]